MVMETREKKVRDEEGWTRWKQRIESTGVVAGIREEGRKARNDGRKAAGITVKD